MEIARCDVCEEVTQCSRCDSESIQGLTFFGSQVELYGLNEIKICNSCWEEANQEEF